MSDQEWRDEWRDAIGEQLVFGDLLPDDVEAARVRSAIENILAVLAPLRERERQQARQEAYRQGRIDLLPAVRAVRQQEGGDVHDDCEGHALCDLLAAIEATAGGVS